MVAVLPGCRPIQPYWLLHGDHDKALQVISDTELRDSRGAISRAA